MSRLPSVLASAAFLAAAASISAQTGNPFEPKPAATGNPFDQPPAAPATPTRVVMKQHTFLDPMNGNRPSHTMLVPEGWRVEGGVQYADVQRFYKILPSQDIKVTAPDGRMVQIEPNVSAIDFRPSEMAIRQLGSRALPDGSANDGVLVLRMPESPDEWRALCDRAIRGSLPTATDVSVDPVEVMPELNDTISRIVGPLQQQQAMQNQQLAGANIRGGVGGQGLSAVAHYTLDGKRYDHLMVWATIWFGSDMEVGRQYKWSIEPSISYRAEAGRLTAELPLLMTIANSLRLTPEWARQLADHSAKMHGIEMAGIAERGRIFAEGQRQYAASQRELARQRGEQIAARGRQIDAMYTNPTIKTDDKGHESFIKAMREVTDYKAADGTDAPAVQLPSHYSHVYGNSQGEYLLTNDGNYNPNLDPAMNQNRRWGAMSETP